MKAYWRWGVYVCLAGGLLFSLVSCNDSGAQAQQASSCPGLPTAAELKAALMQVVPGGAPGIPSPSSGVGAPVWLTLVDSSGKVCAVVHSVLLTDPSEVTNVLAIAHRVVSAQKAATANALSRGPVGKSPGIGVSTAQLNYSARTGWPTGSELSSGLDALVNTQVDPFEGDPTTWGTGIDPLIGQRVGGNTALPGGLPLFDRSNRKVGAIGVSGDFRCTDHVIAWKVRELLRVDSSGKGAYTFTNILFGLANGATAQDQMDQDVDERTGFSKFGFGYPVCGLGLNPTKANDGGAIFGD
jgi:hypothetical protein